MNIEYSRQIYFGTNVEVYTWVKRIGNTSLELYEEIHQNGQVCAKGTSIYVNFNLETQKTEPIPQHLKHELSQHVYIEN